MVQSCRLQTLEDGVEPYWYGNGNADVDVDFSMALDLTLNLCCRVHEPSTGMCTLYLVLVRVCTLP